MTHVVTEACIRCKYTDCVDVCPVDCFREGPNFLTIDPDECIDCAVCIPECPVNAIYAEEDLPKDQLHMTALNAELAVLPGWKSITQAQTAFGRCRRQERSNRQTRTTRSLIGVEHGPAHPNRRPGHWRGPGGLVCGVPTRALGRACPCGGQPAPRRRPTGRALPRQTHLRHPWTALEHGRGLGPSAVATNSAICTHRSPKRRSGQRSPLAPMAGGP